MPGWQPFSVSVSKEGDRATVALRGELDLSGTDRVNDVLAKVESERPTLLVLDVSELTFVDSTGLEVMLRAARRARQHGGRLVVSRPTGYIRRLLEMTAIDQTLDVVEDVV